MSCLFVRSFAGRLARFSVLLAARLPLLCVLCRRFYRQHRLRGAIVISTIFFASRQRVRRLLCICRHRCDDQRWVA